MKKSGQLNVSFNVSQNLSLKNGFFAVLNSMSTYWPAGILSGTTTNLGDFDQCISTSGTFKQTHFVGKYCLATVALPKTDLFSPLVANLSLLGSPQWISKYIRQWHSNDDWYDTAIGICFPSVCKPKEIKNIIQTCM